MFGRGICEKYQSRDKKNPRAERRWNLVSSLVFFANAVKMFYDYCNSKRYDPEFEGNTVSVLNILYKFI
jgi:hypothetical protein